MAHWVKDITTTIMRKLKYEILSKFICVKLFAISDFHGIILHLNTAGKITLILLLLLLISCVGVDWRMIEECHQERQLERESNELEMQKS